MRTIIKIATTILLLALTGILNAQEKKHYLSAGSNFGHSAFSYNLRNGDSFGRMGYGLGVDYSYYLDANWGVGIGLNLTSYRTVGTLNSYETSFENQIDDEGDSYTKNIMLTDWKEQQQALFLEIPLKAYYQRWIGTEQSYGFYAAGGVKIQIPVKSTYEVVDGSRTVTGYYPQWNVLLYDLPQHGFGTYEDHPSGKSAISVCLAVTAEFGALVKLSDKADLMLGGYVDYGLSPIQDGSKGNIVSLDGAGKPIYQSMVSSNLTGYVNTFSVGGKFAIRINL